MPVLHRVCPCISLSNSSPSICMYQTMMNTLQRLASLVSGRHSLAHRWIATGVATLLGCHAGRLCDSLLKVGIQICLLLLLASVTLAEL